LGIIVVFVFVSNTPVVKYFVLIIKNYTFATDFCVSHGIIGDSSPLFYYKKMITSSLIKDLVSNILAHGELYIVEVTVAPGNKINVLIDSMKGAKIDDCVMVSRSIEQQLDREKEDFELEVSSPGLTQPFKVIQQYQKNIGREVEVLLKNGQKHMGILLALENNIVTIEAQKKVKPEGKKRPEWIAEQHKIDLSEVKSTKLVINFK
jgi:ribosome maturation factor RimP